MSMSFKYNAKVTILLLLCKLLSNYFFYKCHFRFYLIRGEETGVGGDFLEKGKEKVC